MIVNQNIAISDTGFIFNPTTGESYSVNPIGVRIMSLLKEDLSNEEIISRMTEEYQVEAKEMAKDLDDFIESLKHYHLVDEE